MKSPLVTAPSSNAIRLIVALLTAGLLMSGCGFKKTIPAENIDPAIKMSQDASNRVYAVSFQSFNTIMDTKIFSFIADGQGQATVTHGTSCRLYFEELHGGNRAELELILKKYGFKSIDQFINTYASAPPIITGSEYKTTPDGLGKEIFDFVQKQVEPDEPITTN